MKYIALQAIIFLITYSANAAACRAENITLQDTSNIIALSEQLLFNVKTEQATDSIVQLLKTIEWPHLIAALNTDDARKTFWINIYNAEYQLLAKSGVRKPAIFTQKLILIAGTHFSLDNIEHGILRKYKWKYSRGYLPQAFPTKKIKALSVLQVDYRIHFALNCGAKSCPPIAFYTLKDINAQLELATNSFLVSETEIDTVKKVLKISTFFNWFKADFGGKSGIKKIFSIYLAQDFKDYSIQYNPYIKDAELGKYTLQ